MYICKNKYFLYAHRDLSVYMARLWESIYIYNSKVSLRGLKVYRWAESCAKIFKNYFFKGKLFFIEMNEREKFLRWVPSESNPCTIAERTRVLFFFIIRKIEFFIYIYKNKYFLYAHRDLSVYIARIWESIYIYNSKVSLRGLKVYRWAESSEKIL